MLQICCPKFKKKSNTDINSAVYLINSWRSAISLSCSALSMTCHALLMSSTSRPSGGTYGRWLLPFLLVCKLKRWASMFTRSVYLVKELEIQSKHEVRKKQIWQNFDDVDTFDEIRQSVKILLLVQVIWWNHAKPADNITCIWENRSDFKKWPRKVGKFEQNDECGISGKWLSTKLYGQI